MSTHCRLHLYTSTLRTLATRSIRRRLIHGNLFSCFYMYLLVYNLTIRSSHIDTRIHTSIIKYERTLATSIYQHLPTTKHEPVFIHSALNQRCSRSEPPYFTGTGMRNGETYM